MCMLVRCEQPYVSAMRKEAEKRPSKELSGTHSSSQVQATYPATGCMHVRLRTRGGVGWYHRRTGTAVACRGRGRDLEREGCLRTYVIAR